MNETLAILGRQADLSLAELESLYPDRQLTRVAPSVALIDCSPKLIDFKRLGGTIKLAKVITLLPMASFKDAQRWLLSAKFINSLTLPQSKLNFGLSCYELDNIVDPAAINRLGLSLKNHLKKTGHSVRLVPSRDNYLSSAQVYHNKLSGPNGLEIILVASRGSIYIAQTTAVQDINDYARRDQKRPRRDSKVGMLPPKLAQIIINLATSSAKPTSDIGVLDPFCGSGVILQEATLMGYSVIGSDISPRMVDYAKANLDWLRQIYPTIQSDQKIEVGDATNHKWNDSIRIVASESYLGRPFSTRPSAELISQTAAECNTIIKKFLKNLRPQLASGARLCLAVPTWLTADGQFKKLPLIDGLAEIGYNHIGFNSVSTNELVYHRAGQFVGRQLLVIKAE